MGRIKYAINVKPNVNLTDNYLIRFTDASALNKFTEVCVRAGILKPGMVCYHLNEWKPITAKQFNIVQYGVWTEGYNININYSKIEHFEHGLTVNN